MQAERRPHRSGGWNVRDNGRPGADCYVHALSQQSTVACATITSSELSTHLCRTPRAAWLHSHGRARRHTASVCEPKHSFTVVLRLVYLSTACGIVRSLGLQSSHNWLTCADVDGWAALWFVGVRWAALCVAGSCRLAFPTCGCRCDSNGSHGVARPGVGCLAKGGGGYDSLFWMAMRYVLRCAGPAQVRRRL
jgi:hypothetical protein